MMQTLSPLTRRFVAIGILVFLLLAALNLVLLVAGATQGSLSDLQDARFRQARLAAVKDRPLPRPADPVSADLYFVAPNREAAAQMVAAAVNGAAASVQLPLEKLGVESGASPSPQQVTLSLSATGPESSVLGFVAELEKGRPIVRLRNWSIARTGDGPATLHLEAQAIAVWNSGT